MYEEKDYIYQSKYSKFYLEYQYTVEKNITFLVFVESYGFSGSYNFCVHKDRIKDSIVSLKNMTNSFSGACKLNDADSDSFIYVEFNDSDLYISGQLGGSYNDNNINFKFTADQTFIDLFSRKLSDIIRL